MALKWENRNQILQNYKVRLVKTIAMHTHKHTHTYTHHVTVKVSPLVLMSEGLTQV